VIRRGALSTLLTIIIRWSPCAYVWGCLHVTKLRVLLEALRLLLLHLLWYYWRNLLWWDRCLRLLPNVLMLLLLLLLGYSWGITSSTLLLRKTGESLIMCLQPFCRRSCHWHTWLYTLLRSCRLGVWYCTWRHCGCWDTSN
jgi:hypothetical protein